VERSVREGEVGGAAAAQMRSRRPGRQLLRPEEVRRRTFTPTQRLLALDLWIRSGLTAEDFAPLVGLSKHTLYIWKRDFKRDGPAALADKPRGRVKGKDGKVTEVTRRAILLLKEMNPDFGCLRISQELLRGQGLDASESQVRRVLHDEGYELQEVETRPHPPKVVRFERARPNQMWMTDIFTFVLKRQNRRVYLTAYLDDHSRYIVSYGLHASASGVMVLEVLMDGISAFGPPEEVLTDNGPQYASWRGKSRYRKELEKLGIRHLLARPKRPQTLGKIERFWGTLYRECVERAVFADLEDARRRIGHFVDHYNFRRPHQALEGMCPADRFFGAVSEVRDMLSKRVADNALELARHGVPKRPFYLAGVVDGKPFSVHGAGERLVLSRPGAGPEEIDLVGPGANPPQGQPPMDLPEEGIEHVGESHPGSDGAMPEPLSPASALEVMDELGSEADRQHSPSRSPLEAALADVRASLAEWRAEAASTEAEDGEVVEDPDAAEGALPSWPEAGPGPLRRRPVEVDDE
jgi:transposase InsO family protein